MNSPVSQNVWDKIKADFDSAIRAEIAEILSFYNGNERERVQIDILHLAKGDKDEVYTLVDTAKKDYRDIIYWAEYLEESQINTPEKRKQMRELFQWLGIEVPSYLKESENRVVE